jgi:hypothetical protein
MKKTKAEGKKKKKKGRENERRKEFQKKKETKKERKKIEGGRKEVKQDTYISFQHPSEYLQRAQTSQKNGETWQEDSMSI